MDQNTLTLIGIQPNMQDKKVVLIAEYFFMLYTFYDRAFYTHGAIAYFERICFQLTTAAERDVKKSIKTNIKHQNKHS